MIQKILTFIIVISAVFWVVYRFYRFSKRNSSPCDGCISKDCNSCPAIDLKAEAERRKNAKSVKSTQS
ncbi:MAG TPA: hypothetical protein DCX03_08090 [Bacteroidales bacterium]|nr:hypothetical protein [Bacteroidales bacterium]